MAKSVFIAYFFSIQYLSSGNKSNILLQLLQVVKVSCLVKIEDQKLKISGFSSGIHL